MKNAQVRIDETIADIVRQCPPVERASVKTYLDFKVPQSYSFGGLLHTGARDLFSNAMSIRSVDHAGGKSERAMRRAVMLLLTVANDPNAAAAKATASGQLRTDLDRLLLRVRLAADQYQGTQGMLQSVFLNKLRADPKAFLASHKYRSEGSGQDNGLQNVVQVPFMYDMRGDQYKIPQALPADAQRCYKFDTVSVPAVLWADVPGRGANAAAGSFAGIEATELTGASVVISTMFTGCAFCFKAAGGRIFAAHILPTEDSGGGSRNITAVGGTSSGARMAQQLAGLDPNVTAGDFAAPVPAGGQFYVYGAGYSNLPGHATGYPLRQSAEEFMNIIGFIKNGNWKIYSQWVNNRTYSARRIYP